MLEGKPANAAVTGGTTATTSPDSEHESVVRIPLRSRGRRIGTLELVILSEGMFDEEFLRRLEALTREIVTAVEEAAPSS